MHVRLAAALAALALATATALPARAQERLKFKVIGQPLATGLIQKNKEQPFFEKLAAQAGIGATVQYVPVDVAGIPDTDGLRVLKSGLFDIVSFRGPQVSRDEPMMLGLDLVGLNTSFEAGRKNTAAYFAAVDKRLQSHFNAKLLAATLWRAKLAD